jgi:3-mercaptopyruvate sulfurtransferase SseA
MNNYVNRFEGNPERRQPYDTRTYGFIPTAINVPINELIDPEMGTFLPAREIMKLLIKKNVDFTRPFVTMGGECITLIFGV